MSCQSSAGVFQLDPDSIRDFTWDWSKAFPGGTVTGAVIADNGGLTISAPLVESPLVTVRVMGAVAGTTHAVTMRVTMADGQVQDDTIKVRGVEA